MQASRQRPGQVLDARMAATGTGQGQRPCAQCRRPALPTNVPYVRHSASQFSRQAAKPCPEAVSPTSDDV